MMESVIDQNNLAVAHMMDGNFEMAITALGEALRCSSAPFHTNDDSDGNDNKDNRKQSIDSQLNNLDHCLMNSPVLDFQDDLSCSSMADDVEMNVKGIIYNRAIRLPKEAPTCHNKIMEMTPVATIFNLGLAYHLWSIYQHDASCRSKNQKLRSAIELYKQSFVLHQNFHEKGNPDILFTMAVMNNLALAYQSVDEAAVAGKFFQHLLSTIMFYVDSVAEGQQQKGSIDLDGFLHNTSHLICHTVHASAA